MQADEIAQHRLDSFKLGTAKPQHRHVRSHSRNASITSSASLGLTTSHEMTPAPPPKRNSHHRRVSSVSTRRESAEIMGVADLSASPTDDQLEKDSIRRNALLALEGKRETKVEIPELTTPFEFPSKPSFPPGSGSFMAKRDSFKPPDLMTLIEEEEEETDCTRAPPTPTTPTTFTRANRPPRLRPLSLTPDSLSFPASPNPKRSSLRTLALTPDASTITTRPRPNLTVATDPAPLDTATRPSPLRRSSISYKTSTNAAGLPTPEATPVSERRFSGYSHTSLSSRSSMGSMSTEDELLPAPSAVTRPLSASEQHFLFKSHNALLARITDLERALSFRTSGTPRDGAFSHVSADSIVSAASSTGTRSDEANGEPLDEMLCLVADLKAERDELKRDVEGWRVRVGDMEKQLAVFQNRLEVERRDAWVARSRVGLVEVERDQLQQRVHDLEVENQRLSQAEGELKQQVTDMSLELEDVQSKLSRQLDPLSTPRAFDAPVRRGLGFTSLDSQSSTDVEDTPFQPFGLGFKLRAVEEEGDDENDELAGYEDEDENDVMLSPSSSFGSISELVAPRDTADGHVKKNSLSKWTFPKVFPKQAQQEQELDRFFPCLNDLDEPSSPNSSSPSYLDYDEEKSKGMFAKGFGYGTTNSCFVLPASVLASAQGTFMLDVVEEDSSGESEAQTVVEDGEVTGGIKITFTPPAEDVVSFARPDSPGCLEEEDDDDEPVNIQVVTPPKPLVRDRSSPSSLPRPVAKPASFTLASPPSNCVTPPNKRPSFIPQPASPSRPSRASPTFSTNASAKPSTAFIRQPVRQPLMPKQNSVKGINADAASYSSPRSPDDATGAELTSPGTIPSPNGSSSPPSSPFSIMSSPIAALSFQTLTNYIPSWGMTSPRSDAATDMRPVAPAGPVKRGFVSKQTQLERLKTRLEREGR